MGKDERHPVLILYGSQTGTAEDVAEKIAWQSRGTAFKCVCIALDDYNIENLVNEGIVMFICSTTGQGEPPDNMKRFWRFVMRKNLPSSCLSDVKYGVLGLGDSSYPKYNFIAKKLHKRIESLGGQPLIKLGLADDQHDWGADAVVDEWVTEMWGTLLEMYPSSSEFNSPLGNSLPPPRYRVIVNESAETSAVVNGVSSTENSVTFNRKNPFSSSVIENRRVTSQEHFQETRLLRFDISSAADALKYEPGDVVMIQPSNIKQDVDDFFDILPFNADVPLTFMLTDDCDVTIDIPKPVTLRELATRYFDFTSVPRRSFFQILSSIATNENEQEKLKDFASPEGTEDRYSYCNRPRRNILEVLQEFHHTCKDITLNRLFDIFPLIRSRAFSIASSPNFHKGELHVLVAVVKYKTRLQKPRKGLCSTWMTLLEPDMKVPLWVKHGGIRFPQHSPCIMVGPGTGISPFRSAAFERSLVGDSKTIVFFGCRNKKHDFYFQDEWEKLPVRLFTAFSRDQEDKIYVQHKIIAVANYLWELINDKKASVFVAGNSKNMPDDVKAAFIEIFRSQGNMTSQEANRYYEEMQRDKRYQQETWS